MARLVALKDVHHPGVQTTRDADFDNEVDERVRHASATGLTATGTVQGDALAIGYGILTVDNEAQAWARARRSEGDKGADAAYAALSMMALRHSLRVAT